MPPPAFSRSDLHYPKYVAVPNAPKVQLGSATAERLGSVFESGAGPAVTEQAGDWRLSNEHVRATFATTEETSPGMRLLSMPTNGFKEYQPNTANVPGALIDLAVDGCSLDFLMRFTQYAGGENQQSIVAYDEVKPVKREGAVGLQFEGSPFENSPLRVQTTYWLAPGSNRLELESRVLGLPAGEEAPPIWDGGHWGYGVPLALGEGMFFNSNRKNFETELVEVQGGAMTLGLVGAAGTRIRGNFIATESATRVRYLPLARQDARTSQGQTTATAARGTQGPGAAAPAAVAVAAGGSVRRDLWLIAGNYGDLLEKLEADRKTLTGTITGSLIADSTGKTQPNTNIRISWIDPEHKDKLQTVYTVVRSDRNGRYSIKLPAGSYFLMPEPKSMFYHAGSMLQTSIDVVANQVKTADVRATPESGVAVRVIDATTSRPLAARVRVEPIPPTAPTSFGFPLTSEGYDDYAYIPAKGGELYLPAGRWIINANHGITYDGGDREVAVEFGKLTPCVIRLKQTSPTPAWTHLELGVRTRATPGCIIEARDIVQMAAAEGIEWLVTGDYEKLTDLRPAIEQLGLNGQMGVSRGFRTILPAHPEWGQFLIYPVKADAPDPAKARAEWAGLKSAGDFIAALRRLYPGALIQSELPYTDDGLGYFGQMNKDAYEISWDASPEIDTGIDAVNIFPARRPWNILFIKAFWDNNMIRGRFYLPATSNSGTCAFGAEPGYPRLLAYLGKGVKASEETVFEALRLHRVQLTSGPFIDFSVNGNIPGGLCDLKESFPVKLRVTAPKWIDTTGLMIEKEDHAMRSITLGTSENMAERFTLNTEEGSGISAMTLKDVLLDPDRDTLLGVTVYGTQPLRPALPSASPLDEVLPWAMAFPIVIDGNHNGKYDPLADYSKKGM